MWNDLAPTPELVAAANECHDYNDCSYVVLYSTSDRKILFAGDSHDKTWGYILSQHRTDVENVDLLITPHHGRDSDGSFDFLDVLKPKLTLFGNASSQHLAYGEGSWRKLPIITNNQAGCIVIDAGGSSMTVWVTHEPFARASNPYTFKSDTLQAWYYGSIV